ncbi:MAG: TrkH family potassium uptake protein [Pseudomonadota bacterium]
MSASARTILFVLGVMLLALSAAQLAPALVDLRADARSAHAFFGSAVIGLFAGGVMTLMGRGTNKSISPRGAIIVTAGSWALLALAAAAPLKLAAPELSWTDAIFEATSGITTTGATIMTGLQDQPAGVLLWRAILQWIGGIGIIVTAMAIWPALGIGGMQLFRMESSDTSEKALPRAGQIAAAVGVVYLALTALCFFAYIAAGMTPFEATAHAMTTIATGGFSTHDGSIGAFSEGGADLVALVFMVLAGLPFLLYLRAAQGRPDILFADPQVRAFLMTAFLAAAALTVWLVIHEPHMIEGAGETIPAWRLAAVNAVSILTGTGYASADYGLWGGGAVALFFMLMFIGGCAGSTTCSVKIFRYQIAGAAFRAYVARASRPHAVRPVRYRGKALSDAAVRSVIIFFFVFFAVFAASACALALIGLDPITAVSGAATTLANVGPGLGPQIGPSGTFGDLPETAKWVMIGNMLIGRLEILTVLALLTPTFWRG